MATTDGKQIHVVIQEIDFAGTTVPIMASVRGNVIDSGDKVEIGCECCWYCCC